LIIEMRYSTDRKGNPIPDPEGRSQTILSHAFFRTDKTGRKLDVRDTRKMLKLVLAVGTAEDQKNLEKHFFEIQSPWLEELRSLRRAKR